MIRNYFLVALRNLTRNKFFSAINIFGLAISMTICMAIIMLVADQMQYDRYNSNSDRIFRVTSYPVDLKGIPNGGNESATSPLPLRDELLKNYSGIEKVVRLKRGFGNGWLEFENQDVNVPLAGFFADPEVLDVFGYELKYGDASTALTTPYSVVLSHEASKKLFKEENPIGRTVKVGELGTYTVTGVLKKTDRKSHIVFEALASMASVSSLQKEGKMDNAIDDWTNSWSGWNYVLLEESKDRSDLEAALEKVYTTRIAPVANPDVRRTRFKTQNLLEITPGGFINNPIGPSLPWVFVYFLGGMAAVIMLTSCFNFTNLSIARSLKRAKEIGVRKVTGAARSQIFTQFLTESVLISFCALGIALLLLVAFKPVMLQLSLAKMLRWDLESNAVVFVVFAVFAVVVGILAGLFPAVVLSGFQPIKVLKNITSVKLFSRIALRKTLLVMQFTVSLIFILSVIVMYNQLDLFLNSDYGFNMKQNIVVKLNNTSPTALKNELQKYPAVKSVSAVSHIPAGGTTYGTGFKKELTEKEWTDLSYFSVDEDYLKNIEVDLVSGTFFKPESGESNKNLVVINEVAVKTLGYNSPADALGQQVIFRVDSSLKTIVGVVKNYNHSALIDKIEPLALMYNPAEFGLVQVRYSGDYKSAANDVTKAWAAVNPDHKIDLKEMDAEIRYFYNMVFGDLVSVLGVIATLAIIISCLGLLGMATYTIESRTKEISVRKVLGSTNKQLVMLLSKGFFSLLVIAVCLGVPLAWFLNDLWLQFIAYRTSIDFTVVSTGVFILIALGGITIGSQTLRAAYTNPVDNLKNE